MKNYSLNYLFSIQYTSGNICQISKFKTSWVKNAKYTVKIKEKNFKPLV